MGDLDVMRVVHMLRFGQFRFRFLPLGGEQQRIHPPTFGICPCSIHAHLSASPYPPFTALAVAICCGYDTHHHTDSIGNVRADVCPPHECSTIDEWAGACPRNQRKKCFRTHRTTSRAFPSFGSWSLRRWPCGCTEILPFRPASTPSRGRRGTGPEWKSALASASPSGGSEVGVEIGAKPEASRSGRLWSTTLPPCPPHPPPRSNT